MDKPAIKMPARDSGEISPSREQKPEQLVSPGKLPTRHPGEREPCHLGANHEKLGMGKGPSDENLAGESSPEGGRHGRVTFESLLPAPRNRRKLNLIPQIKLIPKAGPSEFLRLREKHTDVASLLFCRWALRTFSGCGVPVCPAICPARSATGYQSPSG